MKNKLTEFAKNLRKNSTQSERLLWKHLRDRQLEGLKFRRQQPSGKYIADFVCFEKRVIIEADGGHHASQPEKDFERTNWLDKQNFKMLRFWNNEVLANINGVLEEIRRECLISPSPTLATGEPPRRPPVKGGAKAKRL